MVAACGAWSVVDNSKLALGQTNGGLKVVGRAAGATDLAWEALADWS